MQIDNSMRVKLGNLIRATREARQVSRNKVADDAGISYAYLANIEGGQRPMPENLSQKLAGSLNLPEAELLTLVRLASFSGEITRDTRELFQSNYAIVVQKIADSLPDLVSQTHFANLLSITQAKTSEHDSAYRERKELAAQRLLRAIEPLNLGEMELMLLIAKSLPRYRDNSDN